MRTTVSIDDELLARAKALAAETRRSLGAVVDDALRVLLRPADADPVVTRIRLPTDGVGGTRPGVDLDDRDQMAELLGDNAHPDDQR